MLNICDILWHFCTSPTTTKPDELVFNFTGFHLFDDWFFTFWCASEISTWTTLPTSQSVSRKSVSVLQDSLWSIRIQRECNGNSWNQGMLVVLLHKINLLQFGDPLNLFPEIVSFFYTGKVNLTDENVLFMASLAKALMIPKIEEHWFVLSMLSCSASQCSPWNKILDTNQLPFLFAPSSGFAPWRKDGCK